MLQLTQRPHVLSKTNKQHRYLPRTRSFSVGFTVVELAIVITVIGILATLTIVAYNGIQQQARDKTVLADLDGLDGIETQYGLQNSTAGKSWYSGNGIDSSLNFTPSPGNIIDVVINGTDYCMRAYNPGATTYKSLSTAATKGSSVNACSVIVASAAALAVSPPAGWAKIAGAVGRSTCVITFVGKAYCWGNNSFGQLGNNTTSTGSSVPVAVDTSGVLSGKTIVSITGDTVKTCALASDNQAYCWGQNGASGGLGNNSTTDSPVPVAVDTSGVLSGKTVTAITRNCVIASDNQAYCWGDNSLGQLGNNSTTNSLIPVAVNTAGVLNGKTIVAIRSSGGHTCVVASDGKAYCWGYAYYGELGNSPVFNPGSILIPVAVDTSGVLSGKTILSLSTGRNHTCVIASDSKAYCWGDNYHGESGNGLSATMSYVPVAVDTSGVLSGKTIVSIGAGYDTTCALTSDNKVYCWGANSYGQVGNNSTTDSLVPVAVDTSGVLSGKTIVSLSVSDQHNCALDSANLAYCWGRNDSGQLGNNSTTNSSVPVATVPAP